MTGDTDKSRMQDKMNAETRKKRFNKRLNANSSTVNGTRPNCLVIYSHAAAFMLRLRPIQVFNI